MDDTWVPFHGDVNEALAYAGEILTQHNFRVYTISENSIEAVADERLRNTNHLFHALPRTTIQFDGARMHVFADSPYMSCVNLLLDHLSNPDHRFSVQDSLAKTVPRYDNLNFKPAIVREVAFTGNPQAALEFLAAVLGRLGFRIERHSSSFVARNSMRIRITLKTTKELHRSPVLYASHVRVMVHESKLRIEADFGNATTLQLKVYFLHLIPLLISTGGIVFMIAMGVMSAAELITLVFPALAAYTVLMYCVYRILMRWVARDVGRVLELFLANDIALLKQEPSNSTHICVK